MTSIFSRVSVVFIALMVALVLFALFIFAGTRSEGPLQDFFKSVNNKVAHLEKQVIGSGKDRSQNLSWFDVLRKQKQSLLSPDTILLGAYDNATTNSYERIIDLEDSLHTKFPIISFYTAWGSKPDQSFPSLRAKTIYDLGSLPLISWEPWLNDFNPRNFPVNRNKDDVNKGGMRAVAEGAYNPYIDKWAKEAKNFGQPLFLRLGHEMNDSYRYPWSEPNNTPEEFIAAWQHVVKRFQKAGADNVIWVWSPHPAYDFELFYPGDEYVNWIGLTTINYGTVEYWSKWWSFDEIIGNAYEELQYYGKPIMLAEIASLEVGGQRPEWFYNALSDLPEKYPLVKAVVFFHSDTDVTVTYKSLNWSFINDPQTLEKIRSSLSEWKEANNTVAPAVQAGE